MTRHRRIALAAALVAAALAGGLAVVIHDRPAGAPLSAPTIPGALDSPTPVSSPTVTSRTVPSVKVPGPPAETVHLPDRYRARYAGSYATWDRLLVDGRPLPPVSARCRAAWRTTTRDAALDWGKAGYLCLSQLAGGRFKPQGIAGSGSTQGYRIGAVAADQRNVVIVSSYSPKAHPGLAFPNTPGATDSTRLTVIDLDRGRYNVVELVKPVGDDALAALDSHGSGLAWVGQYLYSSSRTALWLYNADDLMRIGGRYVLPAVSRWSVDGDGGGLSTLAVDRTTTLVTLTSVNYSERGTAWTQALPLEPTGLLQRSTTRSANDLVLTRAFGQGPAQVRSTSSTMIAGTNFQGVGVSGHYRLLNSSSLMLDGKRHGDNVVIAKKNRQIARFAMPKENVESLYLDDRRERYVTVTEHGSQFLFWLPLDHLIQRALIQQKER